MDRIADLVARLEHEAAPEELRENARALVSEILAYHAEGLARLVEPMRDRAPAVLADAAADPLVASLFDLHGIEGPGGGPDPSLVRADSLLAKKKEKDREAQKKDAHAACEICGEATTDRHAHLVDVHARALACVCDPCAQTLGGGGRYRRVPTDVKRVAALADDERWWPALGLPAGMAFFVPRGHGDVGVTAHYPGPAGATEGAVAREAWSDVARRCEAAGGIEPEVQALLVNRIDGAREHWIVGVDRCWELVARVREHWKGLTGGDDMKRELARFFSEVAQEERA